MNSIEENAKNRTYLQRLWTRQHPFPPARGSPSHTALAPNEQTQGTRFHATEPNPNPMIGPCHLSNNNRSSL